MKHNQPDLTIYCHGKNEYQLCSCSWHCTVERWAVVLDVLSGLGYDFKDHSWQGEEYFHFTTSFMKLKASEFKKMLIALSCQFVTYEIF